jgi:hypothetical protein
MLVRDQSIQEIIKFCNDFERIVPIVVMCSCLKFMLCVSLLGAHVVIYSMD